MGATAEHDPEKHALANAGVATGFPPARSLGTARSIGLMLRRAKAGRKRSCSDNRLEQENASSKRPPAARLPKPSLTHYIMCRTAAGERGDDRRRFSMFML